MSKELKAFKKICRCLSSSYEFTDEFKENKKLIETKLKDYEKLEESLGFDPTIFKQDFETLMKEHKALEIIKEKVMPLVSLDYQPARKGKEYRVYDSELYQHTDLTQAEYELLKEVLL